MKKFFTADEILNELMNFLLNNLNELKEFHNVSEQLFQYGEKTAYIECFELIQRWEKAGKFGPDFNVEAFFKFY